MCPTFWIKCAGMMSLHLTMTHMGSTTSARLDIRARRYSGRLITTTSICTCSHHHARGGVLRLRVISTQTQQNCSLKSQHWSLRQQQKRNANTVFKFTVQTPCFDLVFQTYMLQTRCLPFFPNSPVANTVFALLHIDINDLIFTDARLLGTHHAQRCQYTALLCANICWLCSQC